MDLLQNINIKKLDINDFEKIKMFHVEHFANYKISDNSFRTYLTKTQYETFGMFHVKHLIGYVIFLVSQNEADIVYIVTHPRYRKMGVATKLLNEKCSTWNILENGDVNFKIFIEVEVENLSAIAFYKSQNFQIISIRKKYLNGQDSYLMVKEL